MATKGKERVVSESKGFKLYCGFTEVKSILAINPTLEEKAKLYNFEVGEDDEEIEYVGVNGNGNAKLTLDFYLESHDENIPAIRHRIYLEDEEIEIEDETTGKTKTKYINQVGQTSTVFDESELGTWFTDFQVWDDDGKKFVSTGEKKSYRKCLKGEDKLILFMRECLNKLEVDKDPECEISYDFKKLFNGDVKELWADVNGPMFNPFTVMVQVKASSKDPDKNYQELYLPNNSFGIPSLKADSLKYIKVGAFPKGYLRNRWNKYLENLKGKYGPEGFAPIEEIREWKGEKAGAGNEEKAEEVTATNGGY